MLKVRRNLDFGEKSFDAEYGAEVRLQDFEGDWTVVPRVVREIDGGHTSGSDLAVDLVAIGE